jgi:hypothetical protein
LADRFWLKSNTLRHGHHVLATAWLWKNEEERHSARARREREKWLCNQTPENGLGGLGRQILAEIKHAASWTPRASIAANY